jgi:hypothetical protein
LKNCHTIYLYGMKITSSIIKQLKSHGVSVKI